MAHGSGNRGRSTNGRGRGGGCGGCGCGGGCGGGWGGGWAPPCGGWGGCGWGGGCGGYCGGYGGYGGYGGPQIVPMPVPWPYPMAVPQAAPPMPAPPPYGPGIYGTGTGAFGDRLNAGLNAAFPVLGNVRDVASSVRDLMPAVRTARDALQRVRESLAALQGAPAAAVEPAAATGAAMGTWGMCPDRSCVVYELRALNDASGQPVRTAQVPDRTPIEVIGDVTGVILLEGSSPRRWSHVRLRATDGSTIEGWMKPENLVSASAEGTSAGCACERLVPSTGQSGPIFVPGGGPIVDLGPPIPALSLSDWLAGKISFPTQAVAAPADGSAVGITRLYRSVEHPPGSPVQLERVTVPQGTPLTIFGFRMSSGGLPHFYVQLPDGNVGYVPTAQLHPV